MDFVIRAKKANNLITVLSECTVIRLGTSSGTAVLFHLRKCNSVSPTHGREGRGKWVIDFPTDAAQVSMIT